MARNHFGLDPASKAAHARCLISSKPELWFQGNAIDIRDDNLLAARPVPFVDYGQGTYVRKIYHRETGESFGRTEWVVENDSEAKEMLHEAGAETVGFGFGARGAVSWDSMTVNVKIQAPKNSNHGFDWGFLSTKASNCRIFKGPRETCDIHPWDAMILRDCTTNTSGLHDLEENASRRWDILAMKMCEDFDHPWVVVAIRDAGEWLPTEPLHDCIT